MTDDLQELRTKLNLKPFENKLGFLDSDRVIEIDLDIRDAMATLDALSQLRADAVIRRDAELREIATHRKLWPGKSKPSHLFWAWAKRDITHQRLLMNAQHEVDVSGLACKETKVDLGTLRSARIDAMVKPERRSE